MKRKKRLKRPRRTIVESCHDPTQTEVLRAALAYKKAGLSFLPIEADRSKCPAFNLLPKEWCNRRQREVATWNPLKSRLPTDEEVFRWFDRSEVLCETGIAIVAGKVSGNLEILDFDTADLIEPFWKRVNQRIPGLFDRLVHVITPRPGAHIYYRCPAIEGNQKLARIADAASDKPKPKTVIETKGEGGYCLAPPSPDWCHPRQKCYLFAGDKDLTDVPTITAEERQILLDVAREFDSWMTKRPKRKRTRRTTAARGANLRPGDDFNLRADWADILRPHGWTYAGPGTDDTERWIRPDKDDGCSATTNFEGSDLLYVFSSNADPFEDEMAYSKFHAFALLEHDGDFSEAAIELKRRGYGRTSSRSRYQRKSSRRRPSRRNRSTK